MFRWSAVPPLPRTGGDRLGRRTVHGRTEAIVGNRGGRRSPTPWRESDISDGGSRGGPNRFNALDRARRAQWISFAAGFTLSFYAGPLEVPLLAVAAVAAGMIISQRRMAIIIDKSAAGQ